MGLPGRRETHSRYVVRAMAIVVSAGITSGCEGRVTASADGSAVVIEELRIQLAETPNDVIADVGIVVEATNGDLLIADALQPRVRRFMTSGKLVASFGSYGSGPFEFRRITGVAEDTSGGVLLVDPGLGRVTRLTAEFEPDTLYTLDPRPRGAVLRFAEGFLFATAPSARTSSITYVKNDAGPVWTVESRSPGSPSQYPYWGSVARNLMASSSTELVTAYSLLYPILISDVGGELVDSIGQPDSFRPASIPGIGAFSGNGSEARLRTWLGSFDVIAGLSVVNDSLLIVTRGTLDSGPTNRFNTQHVSLDVYDLSTRTRLASDVPLLQGERVLAGGRCLYVLSGQPPDPWEISCRQIVSKLR